MKKQYTLVIALTLSLAILAAPVFGQGQGKAPGAAGKSDTQKAPEPKAPKAESHAAGQATVASKIEANDKLKGRVDRLLPSGTSLNDAASGFRNQGQFLSALHASQNLNIPFDQVKSKMTSENMSLGNAVHALRPDMPEDQMKKEVKKAEAMAKTTSATGTNKPAKN